MHTSSLELSAQRRHPSQRALFSTLLVLLGACFVRAGEVKVDFNRDTKNSAAETEVGYVKWSQDSTGGASSGLTAVTKSFTSATGETVTVSFAQTALSQSRGGTGLLSNWYQIGAQGTAKLVSDGLTVAPANLGTGGEMTMTVAGLSAGAHTLTTYHNAWDALAAGSLGPMDVFLNGAQVVDALQPTIRAATNSVAPIAYLEFNVAGPGTVTTILFSAKTTGAQAIKNVMVNGFEIDTPNSTRIALAPVPADGDEHVNADAGAVTLGWSAPLAGNAVSYDVYFGTAQNAVKNATRTSPEFRGNQTALTRAESGLLSHLTYFWRVDAVDAAGKVTHGTTWYFRPRHLAFPGAEGWGRFARGGRGGSVVEVNSLADYGSGDTPIPGTLRYAIEQATGPRTIVFNVAGIITLGSRLTLAAPYVTVAGQTAPGKGLCTRSWALGLSGAKDAIVRFIRNRPGNISGNTIDGGGLAGSDHSIMDHCSISWSIDEGFSSRSGKNITLQKTLISEALNIAGHQNYPPGTAHGYAASIGGDIGSFHHNLLAHCEGRNWSMAGGLDAGASFSGRLDIRNNVVYNWRGRTTDGGAMEVNFVNNYYKPGAATTHVPYAVTMNHEDNFAGSQRCYFDGNVMVGYFNEASQTVGRRSVVSNGVPPPTYETFVAAPFFAHYVTTQTALAAYKGVLSDVGANQPLDDHDTRVIAETKNGTTTFAGSVSGFAGLPDSQADVGAWENYGSDMRGSDFDTDHDGMADVWERAHGLSVGVANHNTDADADGYNNLEDYLAWLAAPHATTALNTAVDVDLRAYAKGLGTTTFAVAAPVHGTVTLLANGYTARFTPVNGFTGAARFNFTASDGTLIDGSVGVLATMPDYRLVNVQFSAGAFSAALQTYPGHNYQLQTTAAVETGPWTDVGPLRAGTGGVLTFTDAPGGPGRKFYRVRITQ